MGISSETIKETLENIDFSRGRESAVWGKIKKRLPAGGKERTAASTPAGTGGKERTAASTPAGTGGGGSEGSVLSLAGLDSAAGGMTIPKNDIYKERKEK